MLSPRRNKRSFWHASLIRLAEALVVVYVVLDAIAVPLLRPLLEWLAKIRLVDLLASAFAHLSSPVILALLLIPYVGAEPAKIYGIYLLGMGHFVRGALVLAAAYLVSPVLVEQIYQAGKTKLRRIVWFAKILDWLFDFRDRLIAWMQATHVWISMRHFGAFVRGALARWRRRAFIWLRPRRLRRPLLIGARIPPPR